ncbi:hypothetical protein Tco_1066626 [Tanacetum coccineum]|uniref:Uncharacterized protein n=1 Tax=Tanacetum coccineum TaxID=301880 RepID=A0ABQ5HAL8_9ASTR
MNPFATQQAAIDNALITAKVPQIYINQFWNTITKIRDIDAYSFKLDKKKCQVDTEVFHEILQICPRILNQDFIAPLSEEELVTFIQELGYYGRCNMLSAIHTDQMHSLGEQLLQLSIGASLGKQQDLIDSWNYELKSCGQYEALIPDDNVNQDIKDSQAYKTCYDFATGKVLPEKVKKYKKVALPSRKLSHVDVSLCGVYL